MSFVYPHNIPTIQLPYPAQQLTVRYRNLSRPWKKPSNTYSLKIIQISPIRQLLYKTSILTISNRYYVMLYV